LYKFIIMKKLLFYASAVAVLFSSCSKDATEDLGTVAGGNKVFTASIGAEETTRLHLNGAQYIWDVADGVGIASEDVLDANIPAYTTEKTSSPSFFVSKDDYRYLFDDVDVIGKALYAYYPYSPDQAAFAVDAITGDVTIDLGIPATQRYNGRSFYKTTVNAVGYVEEYATDAHIDLIIPTAILNFYVLGLGETHEDGVTLMIKNKNGEYYNLNTGNTPVKVKVNVVDDPETDVKERPSLEVSQDGISTSSTPASKITVDFGSVNEPFDYYESIPVAFVVPANLDLSGATFILSNGSDTFEYTMNEAPADDLDKYTVIANSYSDFGSFNVQFGLDDYYVIAKDNNDAAVRDFILYAYATQDARNHYGTEAARNLYPTEADLIPFVKEMWGIEVTNPVPTDPIFDEALTKLAKQKLLIACDKIDFTNFDAEAMYTKYGTSEYKDDVMAGFYRDALYWYIQNGNAIESLEIGEGGLIPGEQAVVGGLEEPTVINGLTVLGNGFTAGAKLENLEITNCKVVSPESIYNVYTSTEEAVTNVGFVASNENIGSKVVNVVLGEGNELIATEVSATGAYIGGIMGVVKASVMPDVTIEALPAIQYADDAHVNVGQLYGYTYTNANLAIDLSLITSYDVPVIYATSTQPYVIDFSNGSADATYANVVAKNNASIVLNGTSYWSGVPKQVVGGDDYFTAEELAYALETSGADLDTELTHNIDMQCYVKMNEAGDAIESQQVIALSHVAAQNINLSGDNGKNADFEIKNIIATNNGWAKSLFGYNATLSDIKFSNVQLDMTGEYVFMAGLAKAGTAKNVVVDGLVINIADNVVAKSDNAYYTNSIGGVFSEVDTDDIDNVEVKNINISYAGEENLGARAGIIAGTMNVATTSKGVTLKPFSVGGVNAGVNVAVGQGPLNNATKGIDGYKTINNYGTKYKSTKGDIYAFGTVNVTNAEFAKTRQEAKLNLAAGWDATKPFAAGIVFNDTFTAAAAGQVLYDAANVADYDYTFFTNAPLATGRSVWGFNKE